LTPRDSIIQPGEPAPDFTLTDQNRAEWRLSDNIGDRGIVLCFFPFAFTGVCTKEMECLSAELDRCSDQGLGVVGISCDSFAALKAFADQMGFKHTLLSDQHREVCKAYGLYWEEMNTTKRGTVIVEKGDSGPKVRWSESREPAEAMDWQSVLSYAGL